MASAEQVNLMRAQMQELNQRLELAKAQTIELARKAETVEAKYNESVRTTEQQLNNERNRILKLF